MLSTNWSVIVEVVLDMIESMDICCMLHGTWRCWFRWQPMRPPPKSPSLWGTKTHLQSAKGCGVFRSDFHKVLFRKKDEKKEISGSISDNEIHSGCGAGVASNVILTVSFASRLLELQATITSAPQTSCSASTSEWKHACSWHEQPLQQMFQNLAASLKIALLTVLMDGHIVCWHFRHSCAWIRGSGSAGKLCCFCRLRTGPFTRFTALLTSFHELDDLLGSNTAELHPSRPFHPYPGPAPSAKLGFSITWHWAKWTQNPMEDPKIIDLSNLGMNWQGFASQITRNIIKRTKPWTTECACADPDIFLLVWANLLHRPKSLSEHDFSYIIYQGP